MDKIISTQQLRLVAHRLKTARKKIVAVSGSYDILHAGHLSALVKAKSFGDILVVLLNSDRSVRNYKGPNRPIISQADRAALLAALDCVDYVTIFDEITPLATLAKLKPDVFCQGRDWGKYCIERSVVEGYGGKLQLLPWTAGLSTSDLIRRIAKASSQPSARAVFLDRDGTINYNKPEYLHKIQDFKLTPYAKTALRRLSKTEYKIIIITMQSGIGRGYYTLADMHRLHGWMVHDFKKNGIRIDKIYYCPHHPSDGCVCRKPGIDMLTRAVKDFGISLNDSWMVGDDDRDVLMGRSANVRTIKLGGTRKSKGVIQPHYVAKNLQIATNIILQKPKPVVRASSVRGRAGRP